MKRVLFMLIMIVSLSFLITISSGEAKDSNSVVEKIKIDNMFNVDKVTGESEIFKKSITNDTPKEEKEKITEVPVLNYHFFYNDETICNEDICLNIDKFKEQLDYLKKEGYKTLTIDEFKKWMYGEIELYDKSVLITIDDGAFGTSKINGNYLIPILEEYKMHATLFLITAWWDKENYKSDYLDIQSHGYDIHREGVCGFKNIECLNHEELKDDFSKSINLVDNNIAFAYPFYDYTEDSISVLQELDFKIAFVGGNKKATRSDNKYLIPRYPIYDSTNIEDFINMVK